jgi:hypothetical protein
MRSATRSLRAIMAAGTLAAAHLTAIAAPEAEAAAIVTDMQGEIRLHDGSAGELLRELPAGAQLHLRSAARAVLLHVEAQATYELRGPAVYRIDARGVDNLNGAAPASPKPLPPAFRNVRLQPGAIAQASIPMRGGSGARGPALIFPAATWLLDRPQVLRWDFPADASSAFSVRLIDAENGVMFETSTRALEVALPAHLHFEPGKLYGWHVSSVLADGNPAEAWTEFGVADEALRARIAQAQPNATAETADRVAFALLLEALNLRDAARTQWQQIAAERPAEARLRARAR